MRFDSSLAPLVKLLDYYDSGYFSLPDAVVEARHAAERLEAFAATIPNPDADAERAQLVESLADAARSGDKWPSAAPVVKAIAAAAQADELRRAANEALDRLTNTLAGTLSDADAIITDHMRPAHDDAIATARAAVAAITNADADPLDVLRATAVTVRSDLQQPRHDLDRARQVYAACIDARSRLVTASGGQRHDTGEFTWAENLGDVWPGHKMYMARPPWPTDNPSAYFLWLLAAPVKLWMPTIDEADTAWHAAHAADVAARSNAAHVANGGVYIGAS